MSDSKLKIIIDQVGRTIIGEVIEDTDTSYVLKNAATIYVQPNESGQLQVQTIPLFFKEFMTEEGREKGASFTFVKATITDTNTGDILDDKLVNQYKKIVDNLTTPDELPKATNPGDVVKLFDE
tara:strand:- start:7 stop:378 length:372 start_codon:yes stop_codon:yes gene_type:complete